MGDANPRYCHVCGTRLVMRDQREDGPEPWCPVCGEWRYPRFSCAVSVIVYHPDGRRVLVIDQYGKRGILVAGYVARGEDLVSTVVREVREETGLAVRGVRFNASEFYEPSDTLMVNFTCRATLDELRLNPGEVDTARWVAVDEVVDAMRPGSLAQRFVRLHLGVGE